MEDLFPKECKGKIKRFQVFVGWAPPTIRDEGPKTVGYEN
jgi:hypothetical protein